MVEGKLDTYLKVALWGLEGTGKTTFVEALMKSLNDFHHSDFQLSIEDISSYLVRSNKMDIVLENEFRVTKLRVTRKIIGFDGLSQKQRDKLLVNNQTHVVSIYDPSKEGITLVGSHLPYYENADLIIIFLDPTQVNDLGQDLSLGRLKRNPQIVSNQDEEVDLEKFTRRSIFFRNNKENIKKALPQTEKKFFSKQEYASKTLKFIEFINRRKNNEKRIICCISKIDLLSANLLRQDNRQLLNTLFGSDMYSAFYQRGGTDFHMYPISNFGFQNDEDISEKNNRWKPINIEKPLFELLEACEKARIMGSHKRIGKKRNYLDGYIPYIDQGLI